MPETTFAERLAYARALRHIRTGEAPSDAEIGKAVDRVPQWVTKWKQSETPPKDYRVHAPLAEFLEVPVEWLRDGSGDPPEPDVWALWVAARREIATQRVAEPTPEPYPRLQQPLTPVTRELLDEEAGKKKRRRR